MQIGDVPLWECHQLLEQHTVGRVCVLSDGYPVALPVSFRFVTRELSVPAILVRTRPGNLISRALGAASFEVDEIDMVARRAVSVLVRGQLVKAQRWLGLPDSYPWVTEQRDDWLTLQIEQITGRRFLGRADDAGDSPFDVDWQLLAS